MAAMVWEAVIGDMRIGLKRYIARCAGPAGVETRLWEMKDDSCEAPWKRRAPYKIEGAA
jgi:hypothetical protein